MHVTECVVNRPSPRQISHRSTIAGLRNPTVDGRFDLYMSVTVGLQVLCLVSRTMTQSGQIHTVGMTFSKTRPTVSPIQGPSGLKTLPLSV